MSDSRPEARRLLISALTAIVVLGTGGVPARARTESQSTFAATVAALSEPSGYFDTDNLISNERSYLHVAPELRALSAQAAKGGVYIGVGPDQNFSYIAQLRPAFAILIDIRRDNLLLHLLFKALFAESATRVDYLAMLTGRAPPPPGDWPKASIDQIVKHIDGASRLGAPALAQLQTRLAGIIAGYGVPLTAADRATIAAFHRRFTDAGLSLQFNSTGRAPQYDYPTLRDLILEVDKKGTHRNFLAAEEDFQFVKSLQARDLVIPVVGNLAGPSALANIAKFLVTSNRQVSAFYTSNVEFYLFRDGSFPNFVANLGRLPHQPGSLIIRSVFPSGRGGAEMTPGYNSASLTQPIQTLLDGYAKGQFRQYWELVR
jgi:hypothetical protein